MAADFVTRILRGATTLTFSDPYDPEKWGQEEITKRLNSAETATSDGEWQGGSSTGPKILTLPGLLIGDDYDDARDKFDALALAIDGEMGGPELIVYKHGDRFIKGRLSFIRKDDDDEGFAYIKWTLGLRCADPFWQDDTESTLTLGNSGVATAIVPGGTYPALPAFTFVVSTPGTITVDYAATGEQFVLEADDTGTWVIDCATGTVTLDGADRIDAFSGTFLEEGLLPAASTITQTLSGGAAVSTKEVAWRKRYHHG